MRVSAYLVCLFLFSLENIFRDLRIAPGLLVRHIHKFSAPRREILREVLLSALLDTNGYMPTVRCHLLAKLILSVDTPVCFNLFREHGDNGLAMPSD